ncbi:enoyl-hydratase [Hypoxylon sp. NC1633]|nr:enoyl-hydratase [Hypoxylon sp. NC1633]
MSSSNNNPQLPPTLNTPPPPVPHTLTSFPRPHILLVTLNRPAQLNCIARPQHFGLEKLWEWFDNEPTLRCAVITGAGRAFCAGADLKEWDELNSASSSPSSSSSSVSNPNPKPQRKPPRFPRSGFGGLSNRSGLKPVIAAVNGPCMGGGMEMALNCDLVIASGSGARFGLPEVAIGVVALAGALPRLARCVGRQRAAEMALGGLSAYTADQMRDWGVVNQVVQTAGNAAVVDAALDWAQRIAGNSPDAVVVSREGLKLGWEGFGPEQGTDILLRGWYERIDEGENMKEGVKSFVERRKPVWKDSKL